MAARAPFSPLGMPLFGTTEDRDHRPAEALFDVRVMSQSGEDAARFYVIRLVFKQRPILSWQVRRRYSQFVALVEQLAATWAKVPVLPPKMPHFLLSDSQLHRRTIGLQRFATNVLSRPDLLSDPSVERFFDLSFGLWYMSSAGQTLTVDPAQHMAARMIQAQFHRLHAVRAAHTVRAELAQHVMREMLCSSAARRVQKAFRAWLLRRMRKAASTASECMVSMPCLDQRHEVSSDTTTASSSIRASLLEGSLRLPAPLMTSKRQAKTPLRTRAATPKLTRTAKPKPPRSRTPRSMMRFASPLGRVDRICHSAR